MQWVVADATCEAAQELTRRPHQGNGREVLRASRHRMGYRIPSVYECKRQSPGRRYAGK
jgi:hypothetical protein